MEKQNKQLIKEFRLDFIVTTIIVIVSLIFCINLLNAETIYPGESEQVDLSSQMEIYSNYSLIGNTSPINVLVNNLIATITIPTDYYPGSFEVSFSGYKSDKAVEYIYRGGSGGSTKTIYKNNTVYLTSDQDKYIIKEVPVINETTITITEEKITEINKPFYKNLWFYGFIILIIIIIFLIKQRSENDIPAL